MTVRGPCVSVAVATAGPSAIVVMGTNLLTDALNAIAVQRLHIPDDVSLVSLGDPDFARTYTPPITTLRIDVDQVAERAVTMLLDRIERGEQGEGRHVKVLPELIVRGSCAAPPTALQSARRPASRG